MPMILRYFVGKIQSNFVLLYLKFYMVQKINLGKFEMVPMGEVLEVEDLADICKISTLPMKYLGLPLGARYKSKAIWNPILEKMESISRLEKALLIKRRKNHSIKYFLSLFPLSASIANRFEKLQEDFFYKMISLGVL
jgi:hypothetical protein